MKYSNILYFLLLAALTASYSCGTDDEPVIEVREPDMNNIGGNENENDLGEAPAFTLNTTGDDMIVSTDFKDRNLVIFFFGYNCPPCKSVGPSIESELYQKFKSKENFAMIGADQWEGNNAGVNAFQSATGITFPLGVKGADMAKDFGTTYDRLVVVNAAGKIVYKGNSIAVNNLDEVIKIVDDLLK